MPSRYPCRAPTDPVNRVPLHLPVKPIEDRKSLPGPSVFGSRYRNANTTDSTQATPAHTLSTACNPFFVLDRLWSTFFLTPTHLDLTMPTLSILTNVPKEKVHKDLVKTLVDVIATTLGKPKNYVVASIQPDQLLSWGGDDSPAAVGRLVSIGAINPEKNASTQAAVSALLTAELGIPNDRFYLCFEDFAPSNVGWKTGTF